jgi:hypothetical protein
MNPQLMLFTCARLQAEQSQIISRFDKFDFRDRIYGTVAFNVPAKPWYACDQSVFENPIPVPGSFHHGSDGHVFPLDNPAREELVISAPGSGLGTEEYDARSIPIQPMKRHKIGDSCLLLQSIQQRARDVLSARCHGHAVGFVGNQNLIILVKDGFHFQRRGL